MQFLASDAVFIQRFNLLIGETMEISNEIYSAAELLDRTGSIYLSQDNSLYKNEQWHEIESIVFSSDLSWEKITIGDAGESNEVEVARFMTDVDRPRLGNHSLSNRLVQLLGSETLLSFCRRLLSASNLFIRRVQVNRMNTGSFIGLHLDRDSNPDYDLSIVLQFGTSYYGGQFVVHTDEGNRFTYTSSYRSILISRCDLAHEVLKVTSGKRTTLVFFLSQQSGENQRDRVVQL